MKKGEITEGTVLRVDYPNKGIVRIDGAFDDEPVLVKRVMPGERIRLRLKKKRRGRWEGEALKVLEPGPDAANPICVRSQTCGGCAYQRLSYKAQLRLKEEQVRRLLSEYTFVWEGIHAAPAPTGYRNKMEFTFGDEVKGGPLALGLHKRGAFHDIVTADGCQICDADFSGILEITLRYFTKKKIPFYHRMRHTGYLRHLLVRKGYHTGQILIDLVTADPSALTGGITVAEPADISDKETKTFTNKERKKETKILTGWVRALLDAEQAGRFSGRIAGILHTTNDRLGDVIEDQGTEVLAGQSYFTDQVLGLRFKITPFSFFQTNTAGAEVLYEIVRDYLGDVSGRRVYDLYSGTGTIAQVLAPAAGEVIGVEIVPEAVEAARVNAARNGLNNCTFLCGDVFEVLDRQTDAGAAPDVIVLDPPREGVRPQALKKILSYRARTIVYVSCQITSLVRDLPVLIEAGYRPERACSVDLFPYTTGVETVMKFTC